MTPKPVDISLLVIASHGRPEPQLFRKMMATWREELDRLQRSYEVVVVDDGIGSPFVDAALDIQTTWSAVRVVRFRRTFGESVALDAAVRVAKGRLIVTSTWYQQVDPSGLARGIALLEEGVDFVSFRRTSRVDGRAARLVSWAFNAYTRWLTKVRLHDLNCSFRAFRREVVEELHFHGDLFRFLPILAVHKGFRVQEEPVGHQREEGPSTVFRPGLYVRRGLDILSLFFLIKFTRKPLRFFGLVGAGFFALGFVICALMTWQRLVVREGLSDRPLLILGIFLLVLGIIVASIGLIGEIIIFTQGRNLRDFHIDAIIESPDRPEDSE